MLHDDKRANLKMMNRRKYIKYGSTAGITVLSAGCISSGGNGSSGGKAKTLRLGIPVSENHIVGYFATGFAKKINERTNDQIKISVHPNSELGSQPEMAEGVSTGTLSMTSVPMTLLLSNYGVLGFPYLFDSYEEAAKKTDPQTSKVVKSLNDEAVNNHNVRILANFPLGKRRLSLKGTKACNPDELQGVKVRTADTKFYTTLVSGLGAEPQGIEASETASALTTNAIDGIDSEIGFIKDLGLLNMIDYVLLTNHTYLPFSAFINESTYQSLSEHNKKIFMKAAHNQTYESVEEVKKREKSLLKQIRNSNDTKVIGTDGCLQRTKFQESSQAAMFEAFPDWKPLVKELRD